MKRKQLRVRTPSKKVLGIVALILAVAIVALALLLLGQNAKDEKPVQSPASQPEQVQNGIEAQVAITEEGFVPATLSVTPGTTVTWTNRGTQPRAIASDDHPEHEALPGLHSTVLAPHQSYTYTFTREGTFGYHDETTLTMHGVVTVVPASEERDE